MVHGILVLLDGRCETQPIITSSAMLARRHGAGIRALTIADTRRAVSLASSCEGAVFSVVEQEQLEKLETLQTAAQTSFAQMCLQAGVNFDVRRLSGDPFAVLPREARYQDLVIAGWRQPFPDWRADEGQGILNPHSLIDLVADGVHPLLIARETPLLQPRVLLVNDGTPASGRILRTFLKQKLWPDASLRLLAVASEENEARGILRESTDLLAHFEGGLQQNCESGFVCGPLRKVLTPYIEKWGADLVVLGIQRGPGLLRRVLGSAAVDVLRGTGCALYLGD